MEKFADDKPILFFDGVCGLCNRAVDYFIAHDPHARMRFCSLQSEFAEQILGAKAKQYDTVYLWVPPENKMDDGKIYDRSTAALRSLIWIGGIHGILAEGALFVPLPLRDALYNFIAAHRLKWFGKSETCRLPSAEERTRFLTGSI